MYGVDVTNKKMCMSILTPCRKFLVFYIRGSVYKVCFNYLVNWQLLHRSAISSLSSERSSRDPTFLNMSSLWGAPSGVCNCYHHQYQHHHQQQHWLSSSLSSFILLWSYSHHTDAQFEIIDNDGVKTAVAWKTYSNRPFERCGLGILAFVGEGEAEVDLVLIKTSDFLLWKLCCNKTEIARSTQAWFPPVTVKWAIALWILSMFSPCQEESPIQPAWENYQLS